jgi:hypothetical protein
VKIRFGFLEVCVFHQRGKILRETAEDICLVSTFRCFQRLFIFGLMKNTNYQIIEECILFTNGNFKENAFFAFYLHLGSFAASKGIDR